MQQDVQNALMSNWDGTVVQRFIQADQDNPGKQMVEYRVQLTAPPAEYEALVDIPEHRPPLQPIKPAPGMGRTGNPDSENSRSLEKIRNHDYYYIIDPRTPPVEVNPKNFKHFLSLFHEGLYPYNQRLHGGLKICTFCWSFISRKTKVDHEEIAPTDIPPEYTLAEAVGKTDDDHSSRFESFRQLGKFLSDQHYRPMCTIDLDSLHSRPSMEEPRYKHCPPYFKPVHSYAWKHCFPKFIVSVVPHLCYKYYMSNGPGTEVAKVLRGRATEQDLQIGKAQFYFLAPLPNQVSKIIKEECKTWAIEAEKPSENAASKKKPLSRPMIASSSSRDHPSSKVALAVPPKRSESKNANLTNKKPVFKNRAKPDVESPDGESNSPEAEAPQKTKSSKSRRPSRNTSVKPTEQTESLGLVVSHESYPGIKKEYQEDTQAQNGKSAKSSRAVSTKNSKVVEEPIVEQPEVTESSTSEESSKEALQIIRTGHLEKRVNTGLQQEYPSVFTDGILETSLVKKTLAMIGVHSLVVITPHRSKPMKIDVLNSRFFSNRSHLDASVVSAWARDIVESGSDSPIPPKDETQYLGKRMIAQEVAQPPIVGQVQTRPAPPAGRSKSTRQPQTAQQQLPKPPTRKIQPSTSTITHPTRSTSAAYKTTAAIAAPVATRPPAQMTTPGSVPAATAPVRSALTQVSTNKKQIPTSTQEHQKEPAQVPKPSALGPSANPLKITAPTPLLMAPKTTSTLTPATTNSLLHQLHPPATRNLQPPKSTPTTLTTPVFILTPRQETPPRTAPTSATRTPATNHTTTQTPTSRGQRLPSPHLHPSQGQQQTQQAQLQQGQAQLLHSTQVPHEPVQLNGHHLDQQNDQHQQQQHQRSPGSTSPARAHSTSASSDQQPEPLALIATAPPK